MKLSILFLSCMIASSLGCQKHSQQQTHLWRKGQSELPALFSSPQFSENERVLLVGSEIVRFSEQRVGPATVSQGNMQIIENTNGEIEYAKAHVAVSPETLINFPLAELQHLHEQRYLFLSELRRRSWGLRGAVPVSEPQVHLFLKGKKLVPSYQIDFLNKNQTAVERFWISPRYLIIDSEKISTDFDATAWIFTMAQQQNTQEILIENLVEVPFVSSDILQVKSQAPVNASFQNAPWKFSASDPRFDQVQAYYFLKQGLDYFSKNLNFTFPVMVQAETAIGYPEKTNAAFTYQNKIRFGSGDGVAYSSFAKDPSVVLHELMHIATSLIAHLPTQKEGGSMNEAFCDYFAASILNNPKMGGGSYLQGPYRRNLEDVILFSQKKGGLYHDSQIVSGVLWEIRKTLDASKTDALVLRTLTRLGPATHLEEFAVALRDAASSEDSTTQTLINEILRRREWPD